MGEFDQWLLEAAREIKSVADEMSVNKVKKVPALRRPVDLFGNTEIEAQEISQNEEIQQYNAELREKTERISRVLGAR